MLRRPVLQRVIALLLGICFAFGFAPQSWLLVALLAFAVFVGFLYRSKRPKHAFWIGYCFGAGQFLINFLWIANAFSVREGFSYTQGLLSVILLALAMALYPAAASGAAKWLSRKVQTPAVFASSLAACWMVGEIARGTFLTGFPWNPVGALWAGFLPVAQFASVVGVYGLGALTVLGLTLLSTSLLAGGALRQRLWPFGLGWAVFAAMAIFGFIRMPSGPMPTHPDFDLLLVQANIAQEDKWVDALLETHVKTHTDLSSGEPLSAGRHRIIIWPEAAYPYLIDESPIGQLQLQQRIGSEATLIFGANRLVRQDKPVTARNTLFVLQKGALRAQYDKHHLVPFGEYVPYAAVLSRLGIGTLVDALTGFFPGPGPQLIDVPGIPAFAPMICYEGIFPSSLHGLNGRPQWLLNVSNDAWFGPSAGPYQHMNLARFRAIEQGAPLVRSTGTGVSAVFDPYGRVTASLDVGTGGALRAQLPLPVAQKTIYVYTTGGSVWLLLGVLFLLKPLRVKVFRPAND